MAIPQTLADRIAWYANRIDTIKATPTAFGVTAPQAAALDTAIKAAQVALTEAQKARDAAKAATLTQTSAMSVMNRAGNIVVSAIRTFADNQATTAARDAVYVAVQMDPPSPATPHPAPSTPASVVADPNADGTVTVKWKATGNAGSVYRVMRALAGNTTYTQIGLLSGKSFIDTTVPAGTVSCLYQVQAIRGELSSTPSQPVQVKFGAGGAQGFNGNISMAA